MSETLKEKVLKRLKKNITRDNLRTAVRISVGIITSVIIAQLVGLQFATSTCIVTLLGVQATKRDTLATAAKRTVSIAYTILAAIFVHMFFGSNIWGFFVSVLLVALISYVIGWNGTLSINVVVLVHLFLQQIPFTSQLICNEIMRVFIGLTVALIINWRMPTKEYEFLNDMHQIEASMQNILNTFAAVLRGTRNVTEVTKTDLKNLEKSLESGMDNAYTFANNNLSSHAKYYMNYVSMRQTETFILYNIYKALCGSEKQAVINVEMADYMEALAQSVSLEHPMHSIEQKRSKMNFAIENADLPRDGAELKTRAILFCIKGSLQEMADVKKTFIASLTQKELQRYWNVKSGVNKKALHTR